MTDAPFVTPSPGGDVVIYETRGGEVRVDVRFDGETVWLTRRQMAELFGRDRSVVARHIRNVYQDRELDPKATCAKIVQVRSEGRRAVSRKVDHYNLDMIISVGYRVKSLRGAQFRIWATRILREHLLWGHTLDERRLKERGLRDSLDLPARTRGSGGPAGDSERFASNIIAGYAGTWRLLLEYDEDRLTVPSDVKPATAALEYGSAVRVIAEFKRELMVREEASSLFGNQCGEALHAILGSIEQTMFGESLYGSIEERAANLLYLIVKDHPFTDGNKRIGSLLFLLYLAQEGVEHWFSPQALTAVTLLIAESAPTDKDRMVRLVVNLLKEPGE